MRKYTFILLAMLLQTAVIADEIKLPDIKEGLWEITSVAEMVGFPVKIPPMTSHTTECLTKKKGLNLKTLLKNQNCAMSALKLQSNTATWNMKCTMEHTTMNGNGSLQYQYETFKGFFNMSLAGESGTMQIMTTLKGRYLSPCS
ncbi:MAG: DUF3617 family protein [Methylococcales bacterium]|nr:DUF3617 family protein [Methylococcales bacterium]